MISKRETDFLAMYLQTLKDEHGADIWAEVRVPDVGTADAAVLIDGHYSVIEGKAKLSYALLSQAVRWSMLASRVIAVIPMTPHTSEEYQLARQHFMSHGIGIHMVGGYVSEACPSHFNEGRDGIAGFLRDGQKYDGRFAKAGTAGGRRATERSEEAIALEDYIRENAGCTAAQAAREGGMKASQLLKKIAKGEVLARTETVFGKTSLYPLTA